MDQSEILSFGKQLKVFSPFAAMLVKASLDFKNCEMLPKLGPHFVG